MRSGSPSGATVTTRTAVPGTSPISSSRRRNGREPSTACTVTAHPSGVSARDFTYLYVAFLKMAFNVRKLRSPVGHRDLVARRRCWGTVAARLTRCYIDAQGFLDEQRPDFAAQSGIRAHQSNLLAAGDQPPVPWQGRGPRRLRP